MSVEKLPDGSGYKVRWRDSAGASRRKTVRLWRDANALDLDMKRKKAMGELVAHEKGKITLEDFWEVWCRNYASPQLTLRTQDVYGRLWSTHVLPALGPRTSLKTITREDVSAAVSKWSTSLAPSSVRGVLAVLQSVLQRAVEWDYLATNPVVGVKKPRLVKQRESRALTSPEITALLSELPRPRDAAVVAVLAGCGLRPGELRALTWSRLGPSSLLVDQAVSMSQLGPTKTNSKRTVEIPPWTARQLTSWRIAAAPGTGLVFPAVRGGIWTDQGWRMWQRQVFTPAAARAGLAGLVPYDLRHTYISQRIAAGDDILTVARAAGHSPMMTLTVYGHLLGKASAPGVPSALTATPNP